MRPETLKSFKSLHTVVGIATAILLFIGFYCGAVTMFKGPLSLWTAPIAALPPAPALEQTPRLVALALEAHPEARKAHTVHLEITRVTPARLTWTVRADVDDHHTAARVFGASLDEKGSLVVAELRPPALAEFLDTTHRQLGIPLPEDWAMPVVGVVCLLYVLALLSGLIILLPGLVRSLFQLRLQAASVKRRWLDAHNLIGLFSLPFHLVIALTALVFALHDAFYGAQDALLYRAVPTRQTPPVQPSNIGPASQPPLAERPTQLTPLQLRDTLATEEPHFELLRLDFLKGPKGAVVRAYGRDGRHMLRGPDFGIGVLDAHTGRLVDGGYFPGRQPAGLALLTSFFSLHFGNYGGEPVRWTYVLLGLSGAFLFYSGNRLWIEARRRRETEAGVNGDSRALRILENATAGLCLGCVAAVSATIALAPLLPVTAEAQLWHSLIFYAVLAACVVWAFRVGGARATPGLLRFATLATLAIPVAFVLSR